MIVLAKASVHRVDMTSSSMHKTNTIGAPQRTKTVENPKISEYGHKQTKIEARNKQMTQHYPQWTTRSEWDLMVITDKDVMKLEMQVSFIFIFRKQ